MFKDKTKNEIRQMVFPWVCGVLSVLCLVWLMVCIFVSWWALLIVPMGAGVVGVIVCIVACVADTVTDFITECVTED